MREADAAVVLGAALAAEGEPGPALRRRIAHGIALYRQGRVPCLLLSGGQLRHSPAEAEMMRRLALEAGVAPAALLTESLSRSTLENALFCKPIIEARGWRRVLLVTDGYHLPRALYTFRRFGLPVQGAAASSLGDGRLLVRCREAAAFLAYLWRVERARRGLVE